MGNGRLYLCHVGCGPHRVQGKFGTALCGSHIGSHAGTLCFHFASLPPHAQRRKNDALRFRTGRTGAVQAQEDGYLLLGVKHSVILLSISQMSETLFILAIPFFLKHFGIKRVMLISMFAWVFRFGLFALGDPGSGLWMLILSMIVYGMAFDFFNVSGSLFTEMEAHPSIRASAQGLFFMMTNGVGAIIGGYASGAVVDAFSVYAEGGGLVSRDWTPVWLIFAGYALVIGLLFGMVFRYKHNPEKIEKN